MKRYEEIARNEVRVKAKDMDEGDLEEWLETMRYEREKLAIKCDEINQILSKRERKFLNNVFKNNED